MPASHRCGRTWTGMSQAHCPTCCEHFGSVQGFDRHRSTGRCVHPSEVRRKDGEPWFKAVENRLGTTWSRNDPSGHYRNDGTAGIAIPDAADDEDAA